MARFGAVWQPPLRGTVRCRTLGNAWHELQPKRVSRGRGRVCSPWSGAGDPHRRDRRRNPDCAGQPTHGSPDGLPTPARPHPCGAGGRLPGPDFLGIAAGEDSDGPASDRSTRPPKSRIRSRSARIHHPRRDGPEVADRSGDRRRFFSHGRSAAARPWRRRPTIRPARIAGPHAQRAGRLPAPHARRPRTGPLADRHIRLGHVLPPALRHLRLHRGRKPVPANGAGRSPAARSFRRCFEGSGHHHVRVCAPHRACRTAGPMDVRLPAVAPHPFEPPGDSRRGPHLPREEAAVRYADLSRHRFLPVRLEHRQRRMVVQQQGLPGP